MTDPASREVDGSIPSELPEVPPRQSQAQAMYNVDQRLTDIQVTQAELLHSIAHLTKAIDNAKLPEMAAKIDHLTRTVEGAKLPEVAIKIDSLTRTVETAKLPDMTAKLDSVSKAVSDAQLPAQSAKLDAVSRSVDSMKTKVEGLLTVKAVVVAGFVLIVAMVGIVWQGVSQGVSFLSRYLHLEPTSSVQLVAPSPTSTPPTTPASSPSAPQTQQPAMHK